MTVTGLENYAGIPLDFGEGAALSLSDAASVIRRVLRERFWCRLEADDGFVHLGYDYYMYVGVRRVCPSALNLAEQLGLFVEPMRSSYGGQESA